jgi:hypothetical protein
MAWLRTTCFRRRWTRTICAGLCLICYLTTAAGIPIPTLPLKENGQPFPCQFHACGCQTAEQCWSHCCCYTAAERVTWAQTRNVEPPAYAEKSVAQGWHTVRLRDQVEGKTETASRCAKCARCERAGSDSTSTAATCCKEAENKKGGHSPYALGWTVLRCQGMSTSWVSFGAVLPPPPALTWTPFWPAVGWLPHWDSSSVPFSLIPPDPPPRFLSA